MSVIGLDQTLVVTLHSVWWMPTHTRPHATHTDTHTHTQPHLEDEAVCFVAESRNKLVNNLPGPKKRPKVLDAHAESLRVIFVFIGGGYVTSRHIWFPGTCLTDVPARGSLRACVFEGA